jgi:hypothetical protein
VVNLRRLALVAATVVAGCAKRPAMTQVSAPPRLPRRRPLWCRRRSRNDRGRAGAFAATAGHRGASPRPDRTTCAEGIMVNANVKDIFFDFDKYNVRPDARRS